VTRVDELQRFTVGQRTTHNQIPSDSIMLESFEHLSTEQLQVESTGITRRVRLTWASQTRSHGRRLKSHFNLRLKVLNRLQTFEKFFVVYSHRLDG
jgi:hypothetical protein